MKISAKVEYACKAILELAAHWPNQKPLSIQCIAQKQEIPLQFLTHILINLKQAGYVKSVRGKNGGYTLNEKPGDITLLDIIEAIDHNRSAISPVITNKNRTQHVLNQVWSEVDQLLIEKLKSINFEKLSNHQQSLNNVVMFEI